MADLTPTPQKADDIAIKPKPSGEKRRKTRRWVNRITWGFIILAPLIYAVAALGYKLGLFDLGFAFGTLNQKLGLVVLGICGVMGLLSLIGAFIVAPKKGLVPGVLGLVIATERAAVPGVNTDDYIGKTAPVFENEKPAGEELVSVLQTKAFPEIRPLVLSDPKEVVFGEALATAKSMGWKIKEENLAEGRIDATDTTFWYGFDDDITIRLRDGNGGGTIVDVRSLSRIGGSDIGKNADRVGAFLERLAK